MPEFKYIYKLIIYIENETTLFNLYFNLSRILINIIIIIVNKSNII